MDAEEFDSLFEGADFDGMEELLLDPGSPASTDASTDYPSTDYTTDQSLLDDCDDDDIALIAPLPAPPAQQAAAKRLRVPTLTMPGAQLPPLLPPPPHLGQHAPASAAAAKPPPNATTAHDSATPLAPKMVMMPFLFSLAAMSGLPGMAFKPQAPPGTAPSLPTAPATAPARPPLPEAEQAIRVARKAKAATEYEERRRKNRAAADRSRLKKRALLEALPAANDTLQRRVVDLEAGLAAAHADARSLRDQVAFLRSLLGGALGGGGFGAGAAAGHAASAASALAASASGGASSPPGMLVLAVACVLTLNNCGGALLVASEWGGDWADSVGLSSSGERSGPGGRVLLSAGDGLSREEGGFGAPVSALGLRGVGVLPDAAVAAASLVALGLLLHWLGRAVLRPALRATRGAAASAAAAGCALPVWRHAGGSGSGTSGWWAAMPQVELRLLGRRAEKPHAS